MNRLSLSSTLAVLFLGASALSATTLAQWSFQGLSTSGVNSNPSPSSGAGSATDIGMTSFSPPDASGIATLAGTDGTNNSASNLTWKVRGTNGWNSSAAIGSQGAEFFSSTAGEQNITTSFDWYPSTKGEAKLQIQYTTDGSTWITAPASDISIPSVATLSLLNNTLSSNTVSGSFLDTTQGNTWYNTITLNLSNVAAANNDLSFGFRLVNASTGADNVQATGGAALDNTSGNWSFDNVQISGESAIPEPSTYALILGIGSAALVILRRRTVCEKL